MRSLNVTRFSEVDRTIKIILLVQIVENMYHSSSLEWVVYVHLPCLSRENKDNNFPIILKYYRNKISCSPDAMLIRYQIRIVFVIFFSPDNVLFLLLFHLKWKISKTVSIASYMFLSTFLNLSVPLYFHCKILALASCSKYNDLWILRFRSSAFKCSTLG